MKQMKTKARLFALCLGLLMLAAFAGSETVGIMRSRFRKGKASSVCISVSTGNSAHFPL